MRWTPALAVMLTAVVMGGCTLIDQRTFNAKADTFPGYPKPPAPPAPAPPGPPPLLVIPPGATADLYGAPLHDAVAAALARKPDVVFDVVEMTAPDAAGDAGLGDAAAEIARRIVGQGVPAEHVRLAVRPDGGAPANEVRVFVR